MCVDSGIGGTFFFLIGVQIPINGFLHLLKAQEVAHKKQRDATVLKTI